MIRHPMRGLKKQSTTGPGECPREAPPPALGARGAREQDPPLRLADDLHRRPHERYRHGVG